MLSRYVVDDKTHFRIFSRFEPVIILVHRTQKKKVDACSDT